MCFILLSSSYQNYLLIVIVPDKVKKQAKQLYAVYILLWLYMNFIYREVSRKTPFITVAHWICTSDRGDLQLEANVGNGAIREIRILCTYVERICTDLWNHVLCLSTRDTPSDVNFLSIAKSNMMTSSNGNIFLTPVTRSFDVFFDLHLE